MVMDKSHTETFENFEEYNNTSSAGTAYRKLLNSHLSIYNVLTNSELDKSITASNLEQNSMMFNDESFSLSSWQALSNESFGDCKHIHEERPNSVLSSASEDEQRPPKKNNTVSASADAMILRNQEEDAKEYDSGDNDKENSLGDNSVLSDFNSFIMPRLSLISELQSQRISSAFVLSVLGSSECISREDAHNVFDDIKNELRDTNIIVNFLYVESEDDHALRNGIQESRLIFVINDGSDALLDFFVSRAVFVFDTKNTSKLTVINMLNLKYFITLFHIIRLLRPYNIWKMSSIRNTKCIKLLRNYLLEEISPTETIGAYGLTVYDGKSSSSLKKENYKSMVKSFKDELKANSSFEYVDPLQITSNFPSIRLFSLMIQKLSESNSHFSISNFICEHFRAIYAMTITIGLGVGMVQLSRAVQVYLTRDQDLSVVDLPPDRNMVVSHVEGAISGVRKSVVAKILDGYEFYSDYIKNSKIYQNLIYWLSTNSHKVKYFCCWFINCAKDGIDVISTSLYI